MKNHLENSIPSLPSISVSLTRRVLKEDLKMSFKKINKVHPSIGSVGNSLQLLESICLQPRLLEMGKTIIYVDEFKFSGLHTHQYSWSKRGETGYIRSFPIKFQASFILAFSLTQIHGSSATTKTFNGSKFLDFLKILVNKTDKEYVIFLDNARIHT